MDSAFQAELREMNEALLVSSVRQHELTEQAQNAEEALRESEERYRTLFDAMDEGYCIIEMIFDEQQQPLDYRFLKVNSAFEKQSGMHNATGKRMLEFVSDIEAHWLANFGKVALTGEPIRFANEYKSLGRWFDVYAFRADGWGSRRVAVLFYDISERHRLEEQMRQQAVELSDLHRRKDEFLAMLSHELRNPLASIANAVQLLRLRKDPDAIQEQARTIIERQVGQLTRLIEDLTEVARVSTGRVHLEEERLDLAGIVERAVETVRPLIAQRRHALVVARAQSPIWVYGDPGRLEQVMGNLLTNAAKYTDQGGHIWLGVEQTGDEAVVRVRDTGVGIAPELLPRIFDLFTQGERSLDRSQGGLGVGLALVRQLVQLHHGRVEATSTLGQGSEFIVRLPLVAAPTSAGQRTAAAPAESTTNGCRVLVVDDNVDSVHSLKSLLTDLGHDVATALDGPSALEAAQAFLPHAVLLDIGLPRLDGYEVAKRIRAEESLQGVLLVATTGYGQEADRQGSREAGFDHHLVKPLDFEKVKDILAAAGKRRES